MAYQPQPANIYLASTALTATDAVVAAPDGLGTLVSGASTAGSIVSLAIPDGFISWTILIKSWTSGAVYTEASFNSTTGTDGDWVEIKCRRTGTAPGVESVVYALVSNGYYRGNCAGFTYLRARFIGAGTGVTAGFQLSRGMGATFLNSGIPGGSSSIGIVGSYPSLANSAVTAVTASISAGVQTSAFTPISGRDFNITITGSGTAQIERKFVGDATWYIAYTTANVTALPPTFIQNESENGVTYRVNVITGGPLNIRLSQ